MVTLEGVKCTRWKWTSLCKRYSKVVLVDGAVQAAMFAYVRSSHCGCPCKNMDAISRSDSILRTYSRGCSWGRRLSCTSDGYACLRAEPQKYASQNFVFGAKYTLGLRLLSQFMRQSTLDYAHQAASDRLRTSAPFCVDYRVYAIGANVRGLLTATHVYVQNRRNTPAKTLFSAPNTPSDFGSCHSLCVNLR